MRDESKLLPPKAGNAVRFLLGMAADGPLPTSAQVSRKAADRLLEHANVGQSTRSVIRNWLEAGGRRLRATNRDLKARVDSLEWLNNQLEHELRAAVNNGESYRQAYLDLVKARDETR